LSGMLRHSMNSFEGVLGANAHGGIVTTKSGRPSGSGQVAEQGPTPTHQQSLDKKSIGDCLDVNAETMRYVHFYEDALQAFQTAKFVECKERCESLLEAVPDKATQVLLKRTEAYIGEDGSTVVGLTEDELKHWTGLHVMDHK